MNIRADYREKPSGLIDLLLKEEIQVDVTSIAHGETIINNAITVERKTAHDFLVSIMDGRLFNQVSNLKKHYPNPLLIIEGNPYRTDIRFDRRAVQGALVSMQAIWYVPTLFSRSVEETREILVMIARQDASGADGVPQRGGYRPKRLKSRQLFVLQGLPRVGPTTAQRLLRHFKSISRVMGASLEELTEVEGIGKESARSIRTLLDSEWR